MLKQWCAIFLFLTGTVNGLAQDQDVLRINDIQIIGTHNSYHAGIPPSLTKLLRTTDLGFVDLQDYVHPSLQSQLNDGVRQLELDVYSDSKGGLYADPIGPKLVAKAGLPPDPPFDPEGLMKKPGFKVLHVQGYDYVSNCQPLTTCLAEVRDWSRAHPDHLPIFILLEMKADHWKDGMVDPEPITSDTFDKLDTLIRSVFSSSEIIVPDDVRGKHNTLEQAILATGWPTLSRAKGKTIFLLDQRSLAGLYARNYPSLKGRVIFANAEPGSPEAAFVEVNDPIKDHDVITTLVKQGYLVRTMTDSVPSIVRGNDVRRRDAGMTSGAQILSTDFPFADTATSGYHVRFEKGISRCNPVLLIASCSNAMLRENPSKLP